jgi:hypothetical protein
VSNRVRVFTGLLDAAYALEEQAAGRNPELSRTLSGAIALDTLFRRNALDADLQDAALLLERFVTEGARHLDAGGKLRVAELATMTRVFANRYAEKTARGGD